ncbi:MAG: hypothetical protein H7145_15760 [Akkermansiaceae bacterium]|nr:hypothetical protein [Armatimonadota bacterium]
MSQTLLWNFVLPNVVGVISLIGVAWLYILHDYGGWDSFLAHKYRDRVTQSARLTLFCHGGIVAACYGLRTLAGGQPFSNEDTLLSVTQLYLVLGNALLVAFLYRGADHLVAKRGQFGPPRSLPRGTDGDGYPVHHPNLGSGHYY